MPYAELHCHTNFSFLQGASHPEELVEEAVRLGLEALAVTDRNGFYGVVRFAEAARAVGLPTVFGAEVTLAEGSPADGKEILELGFPRDATVVAVIRKERVIVPRGDTVLHAGDEVLVLTTPDAEDDVIVALLG